MEHTETYYMCHPPPRPTFFPYTTLFRSPPPAAFHPPPRSASALAKPQTPAPAAPPVHAARIADRGGDRKSTRLNFSHANISFAVFWLENKNYIPIPHNSSIKSYSSK